MEHHTIKEQSPDQVSLSILGNMHNIGNSLLKQKEEKRKEKASNQRKRKKMQTPRETLLLKTAFVQSPHL